MTQPQPYQVNNEGYGQAVYAVNEYGPGVVLGDHVDEYGKPAYLVAEPGGGATRAVFENGPPPGSAEWVAGQATQNAARAAAQHASVMQVTTQLLLQS